MREITINLKYEGLKYFKVNASYTIDDVYKWEYQSPNSVKEVITEVKKMISYDLKRVQAFTKEKVLLVYKGFKEETDKVGKKVMLGYFLVATSIPLTSFLIAKNKSYNTTYIYESTKKTQSGVPIVTVSKSEKKLVKSSVKTPIKLNLKKEVLTQKVVNANTVTLYNPDSYQFNMKVTESLPEPMKNNVRKYASYDIAILYHYVLAMDYNKRNPEKKINVLGYLGQVSFESGLRPKNGGFTSRLNTYANNPLGIKSINKSDKILLQKDDDYVNGIKVHSSFKIFKNFAEATEHYGDFVNRSRYTGKKGDIKPYLNNKDFEKYLIELKKGGYATKENYPYVVSNIIKSEIIPVLQKNNYKI